MLKKLLGLIFSVCLLLSCGLAAAAPASALFGNARYLICIHKQSYRLDVYQQGVEEAVCSYPIAVAKNPGDKQYTGDNRTPTSWGSAAAIPSYYTGAAAGVPSAQVPFRIEEVCPAHYWTHDFGDGKGVIEGAYGPWFLSLDTGWIGIGTVRMTQLLSAPWPPKAASACSMRISKALRSLSAVITAA